jgi:hypothetical protein
MRLTEFLLARIDEDEALARAAAAAVGRGMTEADGSFWESDHSDVVLALDPDQFVVVAAGSDDLDTVPEATRHIACHDPARVLADCEALRGLVLWWAASPIPEDADWPQAARRWTLGSLAQPYSDHPDYRDEWRP